jgi:thiol-disulfide isomerase/thioredoxin
MRKPLLLLILLFLAPGLQAAEFARLAKPEPVEDVAFQTSDNLVKKLSDYRGRPVLLNLWATWCLPCVKELPALDQLAAKMGNTGPAIIALSIDRKGILAVRHFFDKNGIKHLEPLVDPTREAVALLNAPALPTTMFIDAQGQEIAQRLTGPLDWGDPAIPFLLSKLFRKEPSP